MTIKTFFNWGIYQSNLKRFYLGSVLYFLILFMSTSMIFLLGYDANGVWRYDRLLDDGRLEFSFFVAMCVPTVVALLVYRFVHSKKASIFAHSMPVTRLENYVSTILASFTLMAVPVILNGIILIMMSQFGYGYLFGVKSCLIWVGFNLLSLFVMFSVATISAMLVGNSFALVTTNVFLHIILPMIGGLLDGLSMQFLYGYSFETSMIDKLVDITPLAYLSYTMTDIVRGGDISFLKLAAFTVLAIVFYVAGYLLYRKRNIETSEDVAAYKCLNPIIKYLITFIASVGTFILLSVNDIEKPVLFASVVLIVSAVVYFACDMILKKKVKIWKEAYKGYLGFLGAFAALMCFVTLTGVFGFETYVPKAEDVETAAMYNFYYQDIEPFTESDEVNKYITEAHRMIVEGDIPINADPYNYDTRMHIRYKLKNGKSISRIYGVTHEMRDDIMSILYEYPEYKKACEEVYREDVNDIIEVELGNESIRGTVDEFNELLECIRKDIDKLGYKDIHLGGNGYYKERCHLHYMWTNERGEEMYMTISVNITEKYEETIKWFDEKGYGEMLKQKLFIVEEGINMNPNSMEGAEVTSSW